jgi:hypothetical protein
MSRIPSLAITWISAASSQIVHEAAEVVMAARHNTMAEEVEEVVHLHTVIHPAAVLHGEHLEELLEVAVLLGGVGVVAERLVGVETVAAQLMGEEVRPLTEAATVHALHMVVMVVARLMEERHHTAAQLPMATTTAPVRLMEGSILEAAPLEALLGVARLLRNPIFRHRHQEEHTVHPPQLLTLLLRPQTMAATRHLRPEDLPWTLLPLVQTMQHPLRVTLDHLRAMAVMVVPTELHLLPRLHRVLGLIRHMAGPQRHPLPAALTKILDTIRDRLCGDESVGLRW